MPSKTDKSVEKSFQAASEIFASHGINAQKAVKTAFAIPVSLHCWQGDDVGGFEKGSSGADGGLAVTGNYPGKARTPDELRADIGKVLSFTPGVSRLSIHANYAEPVNGKCADRDKISADNFKNWLDWASSAKIKLDFNATFFGHPKAADAFPLSNRDPAVRDFWIEHGKRSREIAAAIGAAQKSSVLNNFWTPDGFKDTPADRLAPRLRLADSFDKIFKRKLDPALTVDAVECKLFGVGVESCTVGSHEFYMGYAATRRKFLTLDAGHFHPTEIISDKITSALMFVPGIALHVSRGVRWDSDHVVTLTDELNAIAQEILWNGLEDRVRIGLDYFDASINRIVAWTVGARNMRKALLFAALTPFAKIRAAEDAGDNSARLALQEEFKTLPFGAVWDYACASCGKPVGAEWIAASKDYEKKVLAKRAGR